MSRLRLVGRGAGQDNKARSNVTKTKASQSNPFDAFLLNYVSLSAQYLPITSPVVMDWLDGARPKGLTDVDIWLSDPGVATKIAAVGWARFSRQKHMSSASCRTFAESLGAKYIKNLVESSPVISGEDDRVALRVLWAHNISVAYASGQLAKFSHRPKDDPELASFLGLCHDIGFIVPLAHDSGRVAKIVEELKREDSHGEGDIHESSAKRLAKAWTFPHSLTAATTSHHLISLADKDFLRDSEVTWVSAADRLAHLRDCSSWVTEMIRDRLIAAELRSRYKQIAEQTLYLEALALRSPEDALQFCKAAGTFGPRST